MKIAQKIDFQELQDQFKSQFLNLNPNDPSQWPALPKGLTLLAIFLVVLIALWFTWLQGVDQELETERNTEQQLRTVYSEKLGQAINLEQLKKQLDEVRQYVTQLEKQRPSKAEMDALLSDINQAGLGRSLQFDLFRPGQVVVNEYYAELPISIKISGGYHDVGLFASDIAHLSRIVTLNDISLTPLKERQSSLIMEGTVKTFRYLDADEIAAQKKATGGKATPL